ncbi:hypothetical protein D9M68_947270 [compost metagenome]
MHHRAIGPVQGVDETCSAIDVPGMLAGGIEQSAGTVWKPLRGEQPGPLQAGLQVQQ